MLTLTLTPASIHLRRLVRDAGGVLLGAALATYLQSDEPRDLRVATLRAERVELVDPSGATLAALGRYAPVPGAYGLVLGPEESVKLLSEPGGPVLLMNAGPSPEAEVWLSVDDSRASLKLAGSEER